jgi:hypothetical protein
VKIQWFHHKESLTGSLALKLELWLNQASAPFPGPFCKNTPLPCKTGRIKPDYRESMTQPKHLSAVIAEGATPRNRSGKRTGIAAKIWRAAAHV